MDGQFKDLVRAKEKEYKNRLRIVKEGFRPLIDSYEPQFETGTDEADAKETLHEVLNELCYSKTKKEEPDS